MYTFRKYHSQYNQSKRTQLSTNHSHLRAPFSASCGATLRRHSAVTAQNRFAERALHGELVALTGVHIAWQATSLPESLVCANLHLVGVFFARCCLGKVPGGAPFSQLHKGIGSITRTGQIMQVYKPKQIQAKQRQQQISNCGGREDETDARAVRPNSLARCIE